MAELGSRNDNEQGTYGLDNDSNVAQRVISTLTVDHLVNLVLNSTLLSGVTYDQIFAGANGEGDFVLQFDLLGICQTQAVINITNGTTWTITKRICIADLVQEDGFDILQENGDNLLAQGLF